MLTNISRRILDVSVSKVAAKHTKCPLFARFQSLSTVAAAPSGPPNSKWKKYLIPCALAGGGIVALLWTYQFEDYVDQRKYPYSAAWARTCMWVLEHSHNETAKWASACALADMANTQKDDVVKQLLRDGILDCCHSILESQFVSGQHSTKHDKTVSKILAVLASLSSFDFVATELLSTSSSPHQDLLALVVRTAQSISGNKDPRVQPIANLFVALLKIDASAPLAPNSASSTSLAPVLLLPGAMDALISNIVPNCDAQSPLFQKLLKSLFDSLCGQNDVVLTPSQVAADAQYALSRCLESRNTLILAQIQDSVGCSNALLGYAHLHRLLLLALAIAPRLSLQGDTKESAEWWPLMRGISVLLNSFENAVAADLSSRLVSAGKLHPPPFVDNDTQQLTSDKDTMTASDLDESPEMALALARDHNLLTLLNAPHDRLLSSKEDPVWFRNHRLAAMSDSSVEKTLKMCEQLSQAYMRLIRALPATIPSNSSNIEHLLDILTAATASQDVQVLQEVSQRSEILRLLCTDWLLIEHSSTLTPPSATTSPHGQEDVLSVHTAMAYEEWETCPIHRVSFQEGGKATAQTIRTAALQVLSKIAILPQVAQEISLTRCLCSVQLQQHDWAESDADSLEAATALQAINARMHALFYYVSSNAPQHVKPSDLERLIAMDPSERNTLALFATICHDASLSKKILDSNISTHFVVSHLNPKDTPADRLHLAQQCVEAMARSDAARCASHLRSSGAVKHLISGLSSSDTTSRNNCTLILSHLAPFNLIDAKMTQGVTLLYPLPPKKHSKMPQHPPPEPATVLSTEEFDLVFIHGINGNPITTWRVETPEQAHALSVVVNPPSPSNGDVQDKINAMPHKRPSKEETYRAYIETLNDPAKVAREAEEAKTCWHRDWLPYYLPQARIMTIGYDIALTRWTSSETAPLKAQASAILQKLRLLGVGEKPVLFIAHSFGGLIVKEMLLMASQQEGYKDLVDNTRAILFFSTPHIGSVLAGYATGATDLVFRSSSAVSELYPTNYYLPHLNSIFPKVAPHIRTLSIGEIETCFLTSLSSIGADAFSCYYIVPDGSSNPGWNGDKHQFIKLKYNHREVCKPVSQSDERFQLVLNFLKQNVPRPQL